MDASFSIGPLMTLAEIEISADQRQDFGTRAVESIAIPERPTMHE